MQVVRGYHELKERPIHAVVAIGNFDGVHLGHQAIIHQAVSDARARGGKAVAYTFRPHPQVALQPDQDLQLLSTYDERLELFSHLGIDLVIEEPFSREFSTTTPQDFFAHALLKGLGAESIVVGYNFAFGRGREGHLDALDRFCKEAGVQLTVVQAQKIGDGVVSSSRIRKCLLDGDVRAANLLLGREFSYRGVVVKGDARGRTIGFPTANVRTENKLSLPLGVYATRLVVRAIPGAPERVLDSVTNIGVRPTFAASESSELPVRVETHAMDFSGDLYGALVEVRFVERIREERKFSGIEALRAQIACDVESARAKLAGE